MENYGMVTKGGHGPTSYFKNSTDQAGGLNLAKDLLINGVKEFLEVSKDSRLISVADLGCSVGPNTFTCISNIIKAVQENLKINNQEKNLDDDHNYEFHIFFNDLINNDFNTLFKSIPSLSSSDNIQYYVAGVPGPFQTRLFPRSSINIIHSSFALNWLTKVPRELIITDDNNRPISSINNSPLLCNNGRITYALSSPEICYSYINQFIKDASDFFKARSDELVPGGLVVVLMPCREDESPPSQSDTIQIMECFGEVLQDMVKEGIIAEDVLNSFNVPMFFPTISELKQAVSNVKQLRIVKDEQVFVPPKLGTEKIQLARMHLRAVMEDMLREHFGPELIDEMFERYPSKLEKLSMSNPRYFDHSCTEKNDRNVFLLAKRI